MEKRTEGLLDAYTRHVDVLAHSLSDALRQVGGEGPQGGAARQYLAISAAQALRLLADSCARAVQTVAQGGGDEFERNADEFREGLAKKAASFREIVG